VPLVNVNEETEEGRRILVAARHVLAALGKEGATAITIEDTTRTVEIFERAKRNGDGVVPPENVDDPAARAVAKDAVDCLGGKPDRSGKPGFDGALLDRFYEECRAYVEWAGRMEKDARGLLPAADRTAAAADAVRAVRAKVEDYFGRCRLAAYDERALAALNTVESAYLAVAAKDLTITAREVAHLPIARVEPGRAMPLDGDVNPAWGDAVAALRERAVGPILGDGRHALSESDWSALVSRLAPYEAWMAEKKGAAVERLGLARVREVLAGGAEPALRKAVADDLAVAPEIEAITQVERLARYYRDLHRLLNNYVSFTDFYARRGAIFQAGTLYLDGRSCDLCIHVNDAAKHGVLAAMAKTYLAYVDCVRPSGERMTVAAAITAGDSDNLFVGRNGLFYDRRGRDWDATISKLIANPISIGQAFFAPYKKLLRWIEEQVARRAAAADDAANTRLQSAATAAGDAAHAGQAPAAKPKMDIGVVAALGVAVGGITAAMGALLQAFFGLGIWMPLGLLGLLLLISGPSMLIAYLKLRQRNLGPILDANGWAVNTLTRVNIHLGRSLTGTATLPAGAERSLSDPYAPKKRRWPKVLFVLFLLGVAGFGLWKAGYLSKWLPWIPAPALEPCEPPNPPPGPPPDAPK
jgi:hypothetical protein